MSKYKVEGILDEFLKGEKEIGVEKLIFVLNGHESYFGSKLFLGNYSNQVHHMIAIFSTSIEQAFCQ